MSGPPRPPANLPEPTVKMSGGWHCLHLFYRINETALRQIPETWLEGDYDNLVAMLEKLMDRRKRVADWIDEVRRDRINPFPNWH